MTCFCGKKQLIATSLQSSKYVYYFSNNKWFLSNPLLKSYLYSSVNNVFHVSCMNCKKFWKESDLAPIYSPSTKNFKEITLDLDSTLISTEYAWEEKDADLVFTIPPYTYYVFKRPHLDEFLKELCIRFDKINIFTSAQKEYADNVINSLSIPSNKLGFVKTRQDCQNERPYGWMDREYLKDISNSLIIDDKQHVIRGYNNVVLEIPKYHYSNKSDNELLKMIPILSVDETEIKIPDLIDGNLFVFELKLEIDFTSMPWQVHQQILNDVPNGRFNYINNQASIFVGGINYPTYVKLINHLHPYISYQMLTEEEFDIQISKRKLNDDF